MSNIINVKEEHNVLSFDGEVMDVVANSSNFYLSFDLDEEWSKCSIVTVVFDFDGVKCCVELEEDRTCKIPATNASKILFCITAEPDSNSKLSSTILSLNVEPSVSDAVEDEIVYQQTHKNLLGLIEDLKSGNGINVEYARIAGTSQTQVSLTGDESIAGVKNFTDRITNNLLVVPNATEVSIPNILINGDFNICQRSSVRYTWEGTDLFCVDHWQLMNGQGTFHKSNKTLECTDETNPIIMTQWVEDYKILMLGKTLTASAIIDGVRYSGTALMPEKLSEDYVFNICETSGFTFRIFGRKSNARMGVQFIVNPGVTIIIGEVKLEESSFATKYVERTTAEENVLCQRYYQKLRINATGYAKSTTEIRFIVPTTVSMRTSGTVQIATLPMLIQDGAKVSPSDVTLALIYGNCVELKATFVDGSLTQNGVYTLVDGVVYVDAEWY